MLSAFLERNSEWDGVFYTGVVSTGIFCRPSCPARKPKVENLRFYATAREALLAGFRPCRRCRPMAAPGSAPEWLRPLLDEIEAEPQRRWRDADLKAFGLHPERVRRWFRKHHGMTFHAYCRARRLGIAMQQLKDGNGVLDTAFEHGFESASGFNDAVRKWLGHPPRLAENALVIHLDRIDTPLGPMLAGATSDTLYLLEFADRRQLETQLSRLQVRTRCVYLAGRNPVTGETARQLQQYFEGTRTSFDLPVAMPGSDFQRRVWEALRSIPAGETRSYADIARAIGRPRAVRAVARANGDNRLALLVPCHRVIGSDGKLTGYGGGLWRKKRLLELERGTLPAEA